MHRIVSASVLLCTFAFYGGSADAADLYRYRPQPHVTHSGQCCGRDVLYSPRIRIVEQVPYCGDCDNVIGWNPSGTARLRYIGYLPWTRGCALGGCFGYYGVYGGCYWREVPLVDGNGGWAREEICN
jgi:hypothetical protein